MHTIKNWLKTDNIHINLKAESELEAIWNMLELANESSFVLNSKELARVIYENEVLSGSHSGTTGITFYALTNAVSNPLMVVGHFKNGIGYYSKEKKPIDIVVLLAAPERFASQLQEIIFCINDMLADSIFLENIRKAENAEIIYDHFEELCLKLSVKNKLLGNKTTN